MLLAALASTVAPAKPPVFARSAATPLIIAHRGASAERPEHTLAAYALAIEQGADFIEPDLVVTKDGVLVARHENEIGGTTDVAAHPEFAARRTTRTIDGQAVTGWFTEDFTLAELKTLRARERLPQLRPANAAFDGQFEVPSFAEVIALAQAQGRRRGHAVGLYPETKHPSYFRSIGLPIEERLLAQLASAGYRRKTDPVFIQSFERGNLQRLRPLTRVRLVQLIDESGGPADGGTTYAAMVTPAGLAAVARYADAVGVAKALIIPRTADGMMSAPTTLIADAHRAGLTVHAWTFRPENYFLPPALKAGSNPRARGDMASELRVFFMAGLDGAFSDDPGAAVAALPPPRR